VPDPKSRMEGQRKLKIGVQEAHKLTLPYHTGKAYYRLL